MQAPPEPFTSKEWLAALDIVEKALAVGEVHNARIPYSPHMARALDLVLVARSTARDTLHWLETK